jgi:Rho GTPase-activating protein 10
MITHHFFDLPLESFRGKVPFVVTDLIAELRRRNCHATEGLMRLSGSVQAIDELVAEMDHARVLNFSRIEDIHVLAGTLKRYYLGLAKTKRLMTQRDYDHVITIMTALDEPKQITSLRKILHALPQPRFVALAYFISFLREIADNSATTKMTANNLGICIGPTLWVHVQKSPEDILKNTALLGAAATLLVGHYDEIFDGMTFDERHLCTEEDFVEFAKPPVNVQHVQNQICKCEVRKGKLIPFVPLARLVSSFEPPDRPAPDRDEYPDLPRVSDADTWTSKDLM